MPITSAGCQGKSPKGEDSKVYGCHPGMEIVASAPLTSRDSCSGDSGGSVFVQAGDGSWLLAGSMPVDEMAAQFGLSLPPKRSYATVAGFVLSHLQHIPKTGEMIETDNWRFEVVDLDGHRIDKLLVSRIETDA